MLPEAMKAFFITLAISSGLLEVQAATEILTTDFTQVSSLPSGWTTGQWNGDNTPHYQFSAEKGAYVNYPWKQNYLKYNLDSSISSLDGVSYKISFHTYASVVDQQTCFFLSSENYSIVIGNSYTSNNEVYVGELKDSISSTFVSFQNGEGRIVLEPLGESSGNTINVGTSLDYSLTLSSGQLTLSVSDGSATYSDTYNVASDFSFDSVGFINDGSGQTTGIKDIIVTQVPEPATTSLSLLGVVALFLRRRRA